MALAAHGRFGGVAAASAVLIIGFSLGMMTKGRFAPVPSLRQLVFAPNAKSANSPSQVGTILPLRDADHPCGVVVLSLAASMEGKCVTMADAKKLLPVDAMGNCSISDLVLAARSVALHVAAVKVDPNQVPLLESSLILHTLGSHFVVARCLSNGRLVLGDLPRPVAIVDPTKSSLGWQGVLVLVAKDRETLDSDLVRLGLGASIAGVE